MAAILYILNVFNCFTALFKSQKALQWWYYRRSLHLQNQAEQIREGLLQEIFSVRRDIELAQVNETKHFNEKCQDWLAKVEHIHTSLEQVSHQLSPFYVNESLPLAIQYGIELYRQQHSTGEVSVELPTAWTHHSAEQSQVILAVIDELLRIAVPFSATGQPLRVQLKAKPRLGELTLQIAYPDQAAIACCCNSQELKYLEQIFRLLMSGWCGHRQQGLAVTWYFYWWLH